MELLPSILVAGLCGLLFDILPHNIRKRSREPLCLKFGYVSKGLGLLQFNLDRLRVFLLEVCTISIQLVLETLLALFVDFVLVLLESL